MSKDLENIQIIARKLKRIIKPWDGEKHAFFSLDARKTYLLDEYENIIGLNLWNCDLNDISFLELLPRLTHLNLRNNQITDCSSLKRLSNLTHLNLRNNQITDCSFCEHLKKINTLDLRDNNIKELPHSLLSLDKEMKWGDECSYFPNSIIFCNNPIENPPLEIVKQGHAAIEAYFRNLKESGEKLLNEVKVLLVGDGGSGKTSLIKQLFGEEFDNSESQTHGIRIRHLDMEAENRKIRVRFWDFGGQEVMHATHQFFLSKRSLYILVLDGRKEEDGEYWLKHIESFGGDSPILIALNKTDQNPGFDVNRKFLQEKYRGIRGFYKVSCADRTGIDEFSGRLKTELAKVELINTVFPETWFNVKTALETMTEPYISFEKYRNICNTENLIAQDQDVLVDFLNDLGVIVHFGDFKLLDTHVLQPRWVTEAVYKIINSNELSENKGVLKICSLDGILKQNTDEEYCYPREKYQYIMDLMLKFELCYEIDNEAFLIPGLLAIQEPKLKFDPAKALKFRLDYDFLPKSVMPRFIVKRHKDIRNNLQWRTGVVLEDKSFKSVAVVKTDVRDRKIGIWVMGEQKRDYFSIIRKTLSDINNSFEKLSVKELIPLPDHPEVTVEYDELVGYERMSRDEYIVGRIGKIYSVSKLLNGIEKQEERIYNEQRIYNIHGNYQEERNMGSNTINAGNISNSTVVAGKGNKISGGTMSGDTINITAQGDVAFAKDQAVATINKAIRQSGASDDLKANLEKLTKAVEAMLKQMPADAAEEVKDNLDKLVKEATSEKPKRKWYSISGEGLIEAAQAVGSLGKPVIEATKAVLELLGA